MLELLEEGGWHVYYFYCHGEMENSTFRLKLGLEDDPHYLGAADLDVTEIDWPDQPMPLVFINGCETMAMLPEQIHDFLSVLKQLGVSGVIGTEVKVWTDLARPFGNRVLNHILGGKSVGETFLEIRKDMLRRYNPLGLLYNYYSPANLHLHNPAGCNWCATHKPAAAGGGGRIKRSSCSRGYLTADFPYGVDWYVGCSEPVSGSIVIAANATGPIAGGDVDDIESMPCFVGLNHACAYLCVRRNEP